MPNNVPIKFRIYLDVKLNEDFTEWLICSNYYRLCAKTEFVGFLHSKNTDVLHTFHYSIEHMANIYIYMYTIKYY